MTLSEYLLTYVLPKYNVGFKHDEYLNIMVTVSDGNLREWNIISNEAKSAIKTEEYDSFMIYVIEKLIDRLEYNRPDMYKKG